MLASLLTLLQRVLDFVGQYLLFRAGQQQGRADERQKQHDEQAKKNATHRAAVDEVQRLPDAAVTDRLRRLWTRD